MKISNVLEIVKPKYKYIRLTPNDSIRNQTTNRIAKTIASLYKNLFHRIKRDEAKLIKLFGKEFLIGTKYKFELSSKVAYFIYIERNVVEFYFIVPDRYSNMVKEKINSVWSGLTIEEVEELPEFNNPTKLQLEYEKEDALSLNTDLRSDDLLRSKLNITSVLRKDEKVGILYNLIPMTQYTWRGEYEEVISKYKRGVPVDRDKSSLTFYLKYTFNFIFNLLNDIFKSLSNENNNISILDINNNQLSSSTERKRNAIILNMQAIIFSESRDNLSKHNNARSLAHSFETITDDNRLKYKKQRKDFNFNDTILNGVKTNKVSDLECQNFISLPGRSILEEFDFVDKVITRETEVPSELRNGKISIGISTYKGNKQEAFLSNDKEYKNLSLILIGPTRSGKSTLIQNISNDALNNGECVFMFDFVKNCELSEEVAQLFPPDKVLNIDCSDISNMQGMGYNEVGFEVDTFKQYDNAKRQTTQLLALVNSINHDDILLTAKMERYLISAALVVFISNGSIKDVFDVLQNHNKRLEFINKIPKNQLDYLSEYIFSLNTIDDYDKEGNLIGTKLNLIVGIIDRLNKLKANTYMELMLKKSTKGNFDLSKEIQKNQLICLKMPEEMFSTDGERDVYTTYWITKLWLALQTRASKIKDRSKHTKVNLIIDEIYQVNNTEKFLTEKLSRLAKFGIKPVISCHYINQLKYMRNELRSANASYMLISGCDKNNYNELKEELYPFELNDLLKLKRFNSMNLIKCKDGYGKFITKLPKPINNKNMFTETE